LVLFVLLFFYSSSNQISAKSDNPLLNHSNLIISNSIVILDFTWSEL